MASATAAGLTFASQWIRGEADLAQWRAGMERRREEWRLQGVLAARDYQSQARNVAGAALRLEIARLEKKNAELQLEQALETQIFLQTQKFTGEQLYRYHVDQLTTLYFQTYQLAFNLAKQAEKTWQRELGMEQLSFIKFGYWDRARAGLLAGERLHHDLKRMESAFLEHNRRELEITRHVSLRLLNPVALLELRTFGRCVVNLPESFFDLDTPGLYFLRLQQVSMSVPCVAGPFTPVRATMKLLTSRIRMTDTPPPEGRPEEGLSEPVEVATDTVVTSRGQEDAGLFDMSARDGRYLPFEGAGAISTWQITLPTDVRQFDYQTIADVVLHLRLTARLGSRRICPQLQQPSAPGDWACSRGRK